MGKLSRIAWLYIGAVIAAAVVAIARGPFAGIDWAQVVVLGLLVVACESIATVLKSRSLAWSANSTASLAAVILVGPVGAAIVGACTLLGVRRGPSVPQRLFNAGMFALVTGAKPPETPPKGTTDKTAVLKYLKESAEFCEKQLAAVTDEQLAKIVKVGKTEMTGREALDGAYAHMAHTRGQCEVYLRLKNIVPPTYPFE